MDSPIEVFRDQLYAVGDVAESSGRLSWLPLNHDASEPINAFLLVEEGEALLVDTGVAAHEDALVRQLRSLLPERNPLTVMFTRFEGDTLTNLGAVMRNFNLTTVIGGGVSNPFDFFDDLSPQEQIKEEHDFDLTRMRAGEHIVLGKDRRVEILSTSLRNLTTSWIFDHGTHTLFTSDAFGYESLAGNNRSTLVRRDVPDWLDLDDLHPRLFTKFDWMLQAEPSALIDDLDRIFTKFEIHAIAPTHGRILAGPDVVHAYYEATVQLLRRCNHPGALAHT